MQNDRISFFQIVSELAGGDFGKVYRAIDTELERHVALKVLHPEVASDPVVVERFRHEARVAAALNHPGIVTVHSIGDHHGRPYIVMELLPGRDLADVGRVDPLRAHQVVTQLAETLGFAHSRGVVHGHVEPDSIRLIDDKTVKLMGFGLAGLPSNPASPPGRDTRKRRYLSPEQLRGETTIDPRSDIFSLGVVFYELLAGAPPFDGNPETDTKGLLEQMRSLPAPLEDLRRGPCNCFESIVLRCLRFDPAERYPSCAELGAALRAGSEEARMSERVQEALHAARVRAGVAATADAAAKERSEEIDPEVVPQPIDAADRPAPIVLQTGVSPESSAPDPPAAEPEPSHGRSPTTGAIEPSPPPQQKRPAPARRQARLPVNAVVVMAVVIAAALVTARWKGGTKPAHPTGAGSSPMARSAAASPRPAAPSDAEAASASAFPRQLPSPPSAATSPTVPPPPPAAAEPEVLPTAVREAEIAQLLREAEALAARRDWTRPPGACALDK